MIIGAALILLYRYHELAMLKSDGFLQMLIKNKEGDEMTSPSSPISSPVVVYKKKVNQSVPNTGTKSLSITSVWHVWRTWPQSNELYSEKQFNSSEMKDILHHMATAPIVRFDVGFKGTQLKALVELEGGQLAVFKPKRYDFYTVMTCISIQ